MFLDFTFPHEKKRCMKNRRSVSTTKHLSNLWAGLANVGKNQAFSDPEYLVGDCCQIVVQVGFQMGFVAPTC